ncbi:MAG: NAD(P)-dependent alcohol dehydrogenase [Gammaproteobacteria bacterium]|nr:NAD(P)-dependent alcohol dehydrogenase [Gammaproteobacteria bacterium]
MQAIVYRCYGSPDVLELAGVEKPVPGDDEVLVKVRAAAVNPYDWHFMRGSPYIMRLGSGIGAPDDSRMGADFAGTVEAVGDGVKKFKPGDAVFGGATGAFAEYVTVREDAALALKPAAVTFEQAAAVPIAGLTALQALRDHGRLQRGQRVLINGASGGVGTFAVQIAKSYGAEVTGVCSTRNVDMVRSIGADHVVDYKQENYTESDEQYDLIIDMVGNHSLSANRKVLKPEGILVLVGGPKGDWFGPLIGPLKAFLVSPFVSQDIGMMLGRLHRDDLSLVGHLIEVGTVSPVIDRLYSLSELPDAMRYSESGRARGKIVITVN